MNLPENPEMAIEVLERLNQNTVPVPDEPPVVEDHQLSVLAAEAQTDTHAFLRLLTAVNDRLQQMETTRTGGMLPSFVQLLSWIDRRGTKTLKTLPYEDQRDPARSPMIRALLKFHELTFAPTAYDPVAFDDFIANLERNDYWQDSNIATDSLPGQSGSGRIRYDLRYAEPGRRVALLIADRATSHISELGKDWKERTKLDTGVLWSGNLAHELTRMDEEELRAPAGSEAIMARAHQEAMNRRTIDPTWHPGD